jgi:hypothetical protein
MRRTPVGSTRHVADERGRARLLPRCLSQPRPAAKDALSGAIARIDWKEASDDVGRFLRPAELKSVGLWSERFFLAKLDKLIATSGR